MSSPPFGRPTYLAIMIIAMVTPAAPVRALSVGPMCSRLWKNLARMLQWSAGGDTLNISFYNAQCSRLLAALVTVVWISWLTDPSANVVYVPGTTWATGTCTMPAQPRISCGLKLQA